MRPKLYAIFRIPWIRDWLSRRLHVSVQRLHEKYGPIVRVAPDEVSFITAAAWNDVYGQKVAKSLIRDGKWYANLTEGQEVIIVASEADHMRFRKIFGPAFGEKVLHESRSVIMSNIDLLIAQLKHELKKTEGVADMVKWYNWTTFDIIGSLGAEYHPGLKVVLQNIRLSSYGALMERYSIFKRLVMGLLPRHLLEMRNFHLTVIRDKIAWRSEKPQRPPLESDLPLSPGELEANLGLLTMAGSQTSATALSAASYYLCRNQAAAQKLREEITTAFQSESDMCHDTAVIREALRLYPPTPVGLPRRVTVVYITQYSAYHSALNLRERNEFRPELWLGDPSYASDNLSVVQTFITGPYSCIGKSLAYMEIGVVLAKMVWHFEWELSSSCCFEKEKVYALWQKSPMELRLRDLVSQ
ncbi:hypothetical protein ATERTT37_004725 [Aspergillus terreus]